MMRAESDVNDDKSTYGARVTLSLAMYDDAQTFRRTVEKLKATVVQMAHTAGFVTHGEPYYTGTDFLRPVAELDGSHSYTICTKSEAMVVRLMAEVAATKEPDDAPST